MKTYSTLCSLNWTCFGQKSSQFHYFLLEYTVQTCLTPALQAGSTSSRDERFSISIHPSVILTFCGNKCELSWNWVKLNWKTACNRQNKHDKDMGYCIFLIKLLTIACGTTLSFVLSWMAAAWCGTWWLHTLAGHFTCLTGRHKKGLNVSLRLQSSDL